MEWYASRKLSAVILARTLPAEFGALVDTLKVGLAASIRCKVHGLHGTYAATWKRCGGQVGGKDGALTL